MKLELFEEALCCSTGVCGPSVDENLLRITGIFESLKKINQVEANRYNLSSNPADFNKNEAVEKQPAVFSILTQIVMGVVIAS